MSRYAAKAVIASMEKHLPEIAAQARRNVGVWSKKDITDLLGQMFPGFGGGL